MTQSFAGLMVAGTHSGCGKTQVALALASALAGRGFCVQGFKAGPDFIDPTHLAAVTGRPVHNLDGWMLSRDAVLELFWRHGAGAEFCLVEGVMGLFDGASGQDEAGSTAQTAKWLGLPVALVVDARSQGRSVAALVRGFRDFDPDLKLAGVVFTQVGGPGHVRILREAMAAYLPELPCLGFLPRRPDLALPSRHLGLHLAQDVDWGANRRAALSAWIEQGADVAGLIALAGAKIVPCAGQSIEPGSMDCPASSGPGEAGMGAVRLGVALDQAFCFYYQENLDLLRRAGAELVFFSPLRDKGLPDTLQGLYLGGGYPELYAETLAANQVMRHAVLGAAQAGMPVYAECGGFLYLLESLEDGHGQVHPMAGVFASRARTHASFQALGYRRVVLSVDCLLGSRGTELRGHEFHYAGLTVAPSPQESMAYQARDRRGREFREGFVRWNALGSFIHLHFASQPRAARNFVAACASWAKRTIK